METAMGMGTAMGMAVVGLVQAMAAVAQAARGAPVTRELGLEPTAGRAALRVMVLAVWLVAAVLAAAVVLGLERARAIMALIQHALRWRLQIQMRR